jgi:hypothetical protein
LRHLSTFLLRAILAASLPALLLGGCASKSDREARKAEGSYELGELPGWERMKNPGGADYAWTKTSIGASIFADSNCGPRYEDSKLEDLVDKQLAGLREGDPLLSEQLTLSDREALRTRQLGRLDGIPVELGVTVLKKHFCTYDVVLIAPRGQPFEEAWADYVGAVDDFRTTL